MTDYEELVKALRCCGNEGCHKCPYKKHIHEKFCWVIAMKDAAAAIEALQAQLPKRGKWINHKDEHQCSVCRETVVVDEIRWEQIGAYDYCPNCGAKMIGEENVE